MTRLAVALLCLVLLAAPLAGEAQPAGKVPRIGVIGEYSPTHPFLSVFRQGLRELGYIEGESVVIEYRYLHGVPDRAPALAAELIRLNVDVLVVGGTVSARAAKAQTTTVPIVFTTVGDPVGSGLVASLARPRGNATGLSVLISPELTGKHLELLKTAVPTVSRVTVLYIRRPRRRPPRRAARRRGAAGGERPTSRHHMPSVLPHFEFRKHRDWPGLPDRLERAGLRPR
jgi:putative ABC transport system substrate-binding protein